MMDINIITKPLHLEIYGLGEIAADKNYFNAAFKLSGKMWDIVKGNNVSNKGKNIWVYDSRQSVRWIGTGQPKRWHEELTLHDTEIYGH